MSLLSPQSGSKDRKEEYKGEVLIKYLKKSDHVMNYELISNGTKLNPPSSVL